MRCAALQATVAHSPVRTLRASCRILSRLATHVNVLHFHCRRIRMHGGRLFPADGVLYAGYHVDGTAAAVPKQRLRLDQMKLLLIVYNWCNGAAGLLAPLLRRRQRDCTAGDRRYCGQRSVAQRPRSAQICRPHDGQTIKCAAARISGCDQCAALENYGIVRGPQPSGGALPDAAALQTPLPQPADGCVL